MSLLALPAGRRPRWRALASFVVIVGAACAERTPTGIARRVEPSRLLSHPSSAVRISQVYGGGGNSGATYRNDFIELYNAGTTPVSLAGWSVQYASASGNSWQLTALNGTIQPGGYYLVQQAQGAGGSVSLPTPEASGNIPMASGAGKVALVSNSTLLTGVCPSALAQVVDFVGYGSSTNCSENVSTPPSSAQTPTPNLTNTTAALRRGGGSVDTDNNAADFTVGAPAPRNGALGLPAVSSTLPASGATSVPITTNIAVTFNKPVTVSGSWYSVSCTVSGTPAVTVSGSGNSYVLDPVASLAGGETCTVNIVGSLVADAGDATKTMAANQAWSFTVVDLAVCTQPYTPPFTIQGSGAATPLTGAAASVVTQGVVVGDYEGASPALRGFYVQDAAGDGNAATSDAVFVFNADNNSVSLGDVVRVAGTAAEFQGQTQLSSVTSIVTCATGASVSPVDVTLPVASPTALEAYEGMLVRFPQTLYVTEHFQLGRFGQVVLAGGRQVQPTNVVTPGAAAQALQAQNALDRIILDDGTNAQNPDPILYARGGQPLSASNTLRGGDAVANVTGVLTYTWAGASASGNAYRVRPVNALGASLPSFVAANPRPAGVPAVGGTLKVAAMNLLNWFNTFGPNNCFEGVGGANGGVDGCRGASNQAEFDRQWPKTIAALAKLDADIVGLVEVENDGYAPTSAIAELVDRLNAATTPGLYAYLDVDARTGQVNALGTDGIKVGVIYKPSKVTPIGKTAVLNTTAFVNGGDGSPRNRPALAQAFEQPDKGRLVVSVNHLKSKGSACDAPDAGDGQGNCAAVRTNAAHLLKAWLATDPTEMADPDVLIIGDLNAYAKEDAITALTMGGYTDLVASLVGPQAYSYVFDGQWGYLDHALGSPSLAAQVTGVAEWHINADEPSVLDYNTDFKSVGQVGSLYAPDEFRVADHDPVVIGVTLTPTEIYDFGGLLAPIAPAPDENEVRAGAAVPVKFSLGGDRGVDVFAPGFPATRPASCDTGAAENVIEETDTAGQSGLQYDASTDTYTYVWKTERAWAGTCRVLVVRFRDGSQQVTRFRFRR